MTKIWAFMLLVFSTPIYACINGEFTPYVPICAEVRTDPLNEALENDNNPAVMSFEQLKHYQGYSCNADNLVETLSSEVQTHRLKPENVGAHNNEVKLSLERHTRDNSFNSGVNHSATLLRHNQPKEALELLKTLNETYPNEYKIATNMGTAYELLGDNVTALQWIERGIALNPQSHQGSEWVHVKILEAKIAAKNDPHWFEHSSILGLPFRKNGLMFQQMVFPNTNTGQPASLLNMIDHIGLQLKERMSLVPPQDPVVANLLFDLSHLLAVQHSYENAIEISRLSLLYGDKNAAQSLPHFQQLKTETHLTQLKGLIVPTALWMLMWLGVCCAMKAILHLGRCSYKSSSDRMFLKCVFYVFSLIVVCTTVSYFMEHTWELVLQYLSVIGRPLTASELLSGGALVIMCLWVGTAWFLILKNEISYIRRIWHGVFFCASWIWGLGFIYLNPEYIVMPWDGITFAVMVSLAAVVSLYLWVQRFSKKCSNMGRDFNHIRRL